MSSSIGLTVFIAIRQIKKGDEIFQTFGENEEMDVAVLEWDL